MTNYELDQGGIDISRTTDIERLKAEIRQLQGERNAYLAESRNPESPYDKKYIQGSIEWLDIRISDLFDELNACEEAMLAAGSVRELNTESEEQPELTAAGDQLLSEYPRPHDPTIPHMKIRRII